jgi:hypothetical protein
VTLEDGHAVEVFEIAEIEVGDAGAVEGANDRLVDDELPDGNRVGRPLPATGARGGEER